MINELLLFGADGQLGNGLAEFFMDKDFESIFLFGRFENAETTGKVTKIPVDDLSIENNVIKALEKVQPDKNKELFLYSALGGFFGGKEISATSLDEINLMMNRNFIPNFLIVKHFSKIVANSGGGSVCMTTAYTATHPEAGKGAYGISKAAVEHFIKVASLEGKDIKLSVNGIAPYMIDTPANRQWMPDANFDEWFKAFEIGEIAYNSFHNYKTLTGNIFELKIKLNSGEKK